MTLAPAMSRATATVLRSSVALRVFCSLGHSDINFEETLKNVHTKKI